MEHNTIQAVVFDLDGTLLDSTGVWSQIDRQLLAQYHRDIPPGLSETVKKMSIEESSRYFIEQFQLPCTPEQITDQVFRMAEDAYRSQLQLKPHVPELLDWLDQKRIPYGVATATYGELAEAALRRLHVRERLQFLLTEQEVGAPKTNPRIFQEAARKFQLGKRQIAVVEDSLHAVQAAKAAGFFTVGIYDEASRDSWETLTRTATVWITDLAQLPALLR